MDNLEVSADDWKLEEIFSGHGKITSANVIHGRDGVSEGCGFVRFTSSKEAAKATLSLNGKLSLLFTFLCSTFLVCLMSFFLQILVQFGFS